MIILKDYTVIKASDLKVIKYFPGVKNTDVVYKCNKSENYIVTSVAYDFINKKIAIAITNWKVKSGNAAILLFNALSYQLIKEIRTKNDYIKDMAFDNYGKIVFVDIQNSPDPYELCFINLNDDSIHILSKGKYFYNPSWSKDSKKVYFAYSGKPKKTYLGYINVDNPNKIHNIIEGDSICASNKNNDVVYIDLSGSIYLVKNEDFIRPLATTLSVAPRITDRIRYVKGSNDIVIDNYCKLHSYQLKLIPFPYKKTYNILPASSVQSFDVFLNQKEEKNRRGVDLERTLRQGIHNE